MFGTLEKRKTKARFKDSNQYALYRKIPGNVLRQRRQLITWH